MIKIHSYAKINLFLDVKKKLPDGYHSISTVMQSINLHDELHIESINDNKIILECDKSYIPLNEKNTCYKAAALIKNLYHINSGVVIKIYKTIPAEAGLAGGSSNAAAVLAGLNKLWHLELTNEKLTEIGAQIGADVPFCINGGTYSAEGIGDKLTKQNDFNWDYILLVKPGYSMSTAFVYSNIHAEHFNKYADNKIIKYLQSKDNASIPKLLANTLECSVLKFHPDINDIKALMIESGAEGSLMTGSGSAVYGLYSEEKSLNKAYEMFKGMFADTYKTGTVPCGMEFID